jgi:hypothetical protein
MAAVRPGRCDTGKNYGEQIGTSCADGSRGALHFVAQRAMDPILLGGRMDANAEQRPMSGVGDCPPIRRKCSGNGQSEGLD